MLKFNAWGWIIAHEDNGKTDGYKTMRFDTKSSALAWVKEDEVHRWIDNECLIVGKIS
jgi:antibiotic biosynthesis monooxygenase (ABM) superfamily enzyme